MAAKKLYSEFISITKISNSSYLITGKDVDGKQQQEIINHYHGKSFPPRTKRMQEEFKDCMTELINLMAEKISE